MLTPEQIEGFRLAAGRLIDHVNTYLLKDIARRIQEAGKLTSTAAYEAWQVEWLGKGRKELERELSQLLGVTRREARNSAGIPAILFRLTRIRRFNKLCLPLLRWPAMS